MKLIDFFLGILDLIYELGALFCTVVVFLFMHIPQIVVGAVLLWSAVLVVLFCGFLWRKFVLPMFPRWASAPLSEKTTTIVFFAAWFGIPAVVSWWAS